LYFSNLEGKVEAGSHGRADHIMIAAVGPIKNTTASVKMYPVIRR
jgi:hypothetical protein